MLMLMATADTANMNLMSLIENNWFQITLIISLITISVKFIRRFDKYDNANTARHDELKDEISEIKSKINEMEEQRINGSERTRLIMEGVEATLTSLHDDGHNGPVTASLKAISEYKTKMASK